MIGRRQALIETSFERRLTLIEAKLDAILMTMMPAGEPAARIACSPRGVSAPPSASAASTQSFLLPYEDDWGAPCFWSRRMVNTRCKGRCHAS